MIQCNAKGGGNYRECSGHEDKMVIWHGQYEKVEYFNYKRIKYFVLFCLKRSMGAWWWVMGGL